MLGLLYLAGTTSYQSVMMSVYHEEKKLENEHKWDWMIAAGLAIPTAIATDRVVSAARESITKGSHIGGMTGLAVSYASAGLMLKSGNPYLMLTGGAILAIPDPVIYGVGYYLLDF